MDPDIPISYAEAYAAPISVLVQLEVLADARDRIGRRRALIEANADALRASQGRRRG